MQVISRSPTPQHLVVSMKTSLSLGDSKLLEHLPIPAEYEWFPRAGLQTGVAELGDLYVALSRDLASGTQAVPTFHDAVWQQQLFEQIQDSSETGKRINL